MTEIKKNDATITLKNKSTKLKLSNTLYNDKKIHYHSYVYFAYLFIRANV